MCLLHVQDLAHALGLNPLGVEPAKQPALWFSTRLRSVISELISGMILLDARI